MKATEEHRVFKEEKMRKLLTLVKIVLSTTINPAKVIVGGQAAIQESKSET